MDNPLLKVNGVSVDYVVGDGSVRAVDDVSFSIARGEIVGLAGESGSGKSTLVKALMRILPPPGLCTGGQVLFDGQDLFAMDERALRTVRWSRLSMVFQSAMDALNPVLRVRDQLDDTLRAHGDITPEFRTRRVDELLDMVELPRSVAGQYPHQLSGGMRQRVVIAISLALAPDLLILDEPTTALDVLTERAILDRLVALRDELGFSVLFITHDLPLMLDYCDSIGILYAGRLVELGETATLVEAAAHPYTQGLLSCFPSLYGDIATIQGIPGSPPSLLSPPSGCRFHPRCPSVTPRCSQETPQLQPLPSGQQAACWNMESG